jgi:formylglycine-generating enzyme required for sulfatase activity
MTRHNKFDVCVYQALLAAMILAATQVNVSGAESEMLKFKIRGVDFELVQIPAGQFQMGSQAGDSDERPVHRVRIKEDFYIGRTEVTVRQFRAFAQATGYKTEAEKGNWGFNYSWGFTIVPGRGFNWHKSKYPQTEDNPAVYISWNDAVAFCRWFSKETGRHYRLPSEAEWEYACRGGKDFDYAENPNETGWYRDNSGGKTHPAGLKKPNAWGLYDMHGNAWEWCLDVWHSNYKGAPTDGSPWLREDYVPRIAIRRVLRGGAWCRLDFELSASYRYRGTQDFRSDGSGFRIVSSATTMNEEPEISKPSHEYPNRQNVTRDKSVVNIDGEDFEFVRIEAGEFFKGSDKDGEEQPIHKVRIGYSFDIGRTEVTVGQFRIFTEATGYQTDAEKERWAWTRTGRHDWDPAQLICWWYLPFIQSDDEPVTCISWYDAIEFCKWLSSKTGTQIRLPSTSEWEYACRAGTTGGFAGDVEQMAWYRFNSGYRTHKVAQKKPNAWGLYDMHGNVWEWCMDMWHKNYDGAPTNGSAWTESKSFEPIMRGGSFLNPPWWLRSANNMRNNPGNRFSYNQGIRLVRVVEPTSP